MNYGVMMQGVKTDIRLSMGHVKSLGLSPRRHPLHHHLSPLQSDAHQKETYFEEVASQNQRTSSLRLAKTAQKQTSRPVLDLNMEGSRYGSLPSRGGVSAGEEESAKMEQNETPALDLLVCVASSREEALRPVVENLQHRGWRCVLNGREKETLILLSDTQDSSAVSHSVSLCFGVQLPFPKTPFDSEQLAAALSTIMSLSYQQSPERDPRLAEGKSAIRTCLQDLAPPQPGKEPEILNGVCVLSEEALNWGEQLCRDQAYHLATCLYHWSIEQLVCYLAPAAQQSASRDLLAHLELALLTSLKDRLRAPRVSAIRLAAHLEQCLVARYLSASLYTLDLVLEELADRASELSPKCLFNFLNVAEEKAAPLWERGAIEGCAALYESVMTGILSLPGEQDFLNQVYLQLSPLLEPSFRELPCHERASPLQEQVSALMDWLRELK